MLQRYLILWLLVSSWAAFRWVDWFPNWIDPFSPQLSDQYLQWLIVTTMFAIGVMLPHDEVHQVVRRWPAVLAGTAIQYTTMPLLAYLVGTLGGLDDDGFIGVIIVGCVPGAMASNVLTLNARGNTSYSVSLTATATLLSPLVVPLAMGLTLSAQTRFDAKRLIDTSWFLLLTVVVPVVAGHLLTRYGRRWNRWHVWSIRIGSSVANLAILGIIAAVVGRNRTYLAGFRFDLLGALLVVNVGGYAAGYVGGWLLRMPEPMRRALTLEIGMQNAGLGATLAVELFPHHDAIAIAPAMYTFGCMLTGTVLSSLWAMVPLQPTNDPARPPPDLD